MFNILRKDAPSSKLHISQGQFLKRSDPDQPPAKKKPYSTIMNQAFTHSVVGPPSSILSALVHISQACVILPKELYELVWNDISKNLQTLEYSRVIMPLSALLEGDFFNSYIKSGNKISCLLLWLLSRICRFLATHLLPTHLPPVLAFFQPLIWLWPGIQYRGSSI